MTLPGETICSGAALVCDECGRQPIHDLRLSSSGAPAAIQTWCACGPYSRESIYIESPRRAGIILEACQKAVAAADNLTPIEVLYLARVLEAFRVLR